MSEPDPVEQILERAAVAQWMRREILENVSAPAPMRAACYLAAAMTAAMPSRMVCDM